MFVEKFYSKYICQKYFVENILVGTNYRKYLLYFGRRLTQNLIKHEAKTKTQEAKSADRDVVNKNVFYQNSDKLMR